MRTLLLLGFALAFAMQSGRASADYTLLSPLVVTPRLELHEQEYHSIFFTDPEPTLAYQICNTSQTDDAVVWWAGALLGRWAGDPLPPDTCIYRRDVVEFEVEDDTVDENDTYRISSFVDRRGFGREDMSTVVWCRQSFFDFCRSDATRNIGRYYYEVWSSPESGNFGTVDRELLGVYILKRDELIDVSIRYDLEDDTLLVFRGTSDFESFPNGVEISGPINEPQRYSDFVDFGENPVGGNLVISLDNFEGEVDLVLPSSFFETFNLEVSTVSEGSIGFVSTVMLPLGDF